MRRNTLVVFAAWIMLLVVSMMVGVRRLWGWPLWVLTFAVGALLMRLSSREGRQGREEWVWWDRELTARGAVRDVDDPHVHEWLDREEWNEVFRALEQMPPGERSLRKAIADIEPGILSE